ncbi:Protein of unknown function [Halobacillus dabanensis]|uniref:DUF2812 domain-containing protein n=1 Tax=Halobacillus dabanensis TaxID=240302 RepID=A0A1I3Q6Q8_HALDA|nr:DUF2812 domain-containing protein [Halobacillus dabanensis]SFJ29349.1 Protein of unknown function [Halobacillus dabanensis]
MKVSFFRPLWSYDTRKTEQWLQDKASNGLFLTSFNRWTRKFYFKEARSNPCTYRIQYEKVDYFPTSLAEDGWKTILKEGRWRFIRHDHIPAKKPLPDGIIARNKIHLYSFLAIFLYMLLSASMVGLLSFFAIMGGGGAPTFVPSPYWAITITAGLTLWSFVPYSTYTIHKGLKKLKNTPEPVAEKNHNPITLTKWRFGWQYAPDRLEEWLETKEEEGYHLEKVSRFGFRFSFSKGEPRKVSYAADFQRSIESDYFYLHSERGWRNLFHTSSTFLSWTLWAKGYGGEEGKPELYSDGYHKLRHAKRTAIWNGGIFFPLTILYVWLITLNMDGIFSGDTFDATFWLVAVQTVVVIEFGYFSVRSLRYYWRVRNTVL